LERSLIELGQKTSRNQEFPNIPSNSGQMNIVVLLTTIEQQEALKIGRTSKR